jgi:phospholipase C
MDENTQMTAKVKCTRHMPTGDQTWLEFQADYDDGRNKEWAKYTPAFSVSTTVKNEIAEKYVLGEAYTVTFTKSTD